MHTFDVSYFLCLFIFVVLGGSPAVLVLLHFSLFLWKPRGLFCSREEKCQGGHHPLGMGGQGALSTWLCRWGQASCRTRQAGEQCGQAAQMALPGSVCTPELHSWFVLCLLQDEKPFQKGFVASTPTCYHVLWTYPSKAMLNWTSMHFVLFCSIDVPQVYKCHDSSTKHRRFTSLSVSVFKVYLPRLQYIKHWEMGISRVQFSALKLAPALNCHLKMPVSFYWLQKVLTETNLLCLKLASVKTPLCVSYCNPYWNGSI